MKDLNSIIQLEDFRIQRRPPLTAWMKAQTAERDRLNAKILNAVKEPPRGGVLSGTFICAHPPDYRGRPTIHWGEADWRALFVELKELGISIAILQASAWIDFEECYYPSALFKGFQTWNIVEPMLKAAAKERMTVYLGGAGILYSDKELGLHATGTQKAAKAARRELACYKELLNRYKGAFYGYYLSPETGYSEDHDKTHLACWHSFFERVTNGVKELTPEVPILTSPYTPYTPGAEQRATDYLAALHQNCPITAFAPQDSIGTFNNLSFLKAGLTIWKNVCAAVGAEFWVNCESFSITDFGGPVCSIIPAEPKRFSLQLATANSLGAKKLITWEAPYFLMPDGDIRAQELRTAYQKHRRRSAN